MKTTTMAAMGVAAVLLGTGWTQTACGQGALTPPGAPAPSMRTLGQIYTEVTLAEPRVPLSDLATPGMSNYVFAITNSGSYYLPGNLTTTNGGILILADDVDLDLCGFKLEGDPAEAYCGIYFPECNGVSIRNGTIARFGDMGISAGNLTRTGLRLQGLTVVQNTQEGIAISGLGSMVENCIVVSNGAAGISSTGLNTFIADCASVYNTYDGIYAGLCAVLRGNTSAFNGWTGIRAGGECMVEGNSARDNTREGFDTGNNSVVRGNTASGNGWSGIDGGAGSLVTENAVSGNNTNLHYLAGGIFVERGSMVLNNTVHTNQVQGIYVWSTPCVIEGNAISQCPTGITFRSSGAVYVNNRFGDVGIDIDGTGTDGGGNISY